MFLATNAVFAEAGTVVWLVALGNQPPRARYPGTQLAGEVSGSKSRIAGDGRRESCQFG